MPNEGITIEGLSELQTRLDALRTDQATKILRKALRADAKWVQAAMVERAPVRPPLPSGTALPVGALKFDIEIRTLSRVAEGAAAVSVGPGKYTKHVAHWVEFGHRLVAGGRLSKKGKGPGKHIGDVDANPFLRPAWEASEAVGLQAFQDTVKAELDKLQTPGGK